MKIPAYSAIENICVLIGAKDERGIYRMISQSADIFGFSFEVDSNKKLMSQVSEKLSNLGLEKSSIAFASEIAEEVTNLNGKNFLLLLATIDQLPSGFFTETFPDLLRRLPQERVRLPFLRAWQILMGSHLEVQNAVTFEDN